MVAQMEWERSISLQKFLSDEHTVASPEEELRTRNVIDKLKEILTTWIKRVAYQRRLPQNQIKAASATILPYGSYGLGVYDTESSIDALCVVPCFASMAEDFFIVLHNILAGRPEVSGIQRVKDISVPFLRFKFDGILIDLPFARLKVTSVPENMDILNPLLITEIDEASWQSLSGLRENTSILQIVPEVKIFQDLLRCVKSWAKRRGVYSDLFGYFESIHLAVLVAFICQKNPSESLVGLISIFFKTFALWPWPDPVLLQGGGAVLPPLSPEKRLLMPLQLPSSPNKYCQSNITTSTFN